MDKIYQLNDGLLLEYKEMMVNQFVHLKTKSHYSILESSIKIDDLIDKAVEDNMPAIALTIQITYLVQWSLQKGS